MTSEERIDKALLIATQYGGVDGGHHKQWVIAQMVKALAGDDYPKWLDDYCNGVEGETFEWDEGIAP